MTKDLTDRYASRPPFCRHGWVTISQNSDLGLTACGLLLPSDPPSQPLPLLQHGPAAAEGTTLVTCPGSWRRGGGVMAEGYRVPDVAAPYRIAPAGCAPNPRRPRKTWEVHAFWPSSDPSISSQSIHPPKPAGPVGINVWRPSTYRMYFVVPRLPHPCPCLVIFCPAVACPASLPACQPVLPSLGHAQPACG
jgi:hypothetical protein